jgi:RNA polymerase sigma factor (sigma-70 family)
MPEIRADRPQDRIEVLKSWKCISRDLLVPDEAAPLPDFTSMRLLAAASRGDTVGESDLFVRYLERLTALARARLSANIQARTDPEDVVLSVYRSFFAGARRGQFAIQRSGDLWRLLAAIAIHKVRRTVRHHRAAKRSINREEPASEGIDFSAEKTPSVEDGVALAEYLESIYQLLDPTQRQIIEMRLRGMSHSEIASEAKCSERTVRRHLAAFQQRLRQELDEHLEQP